jgi:hypothetical protein
VPGNRARESEMLTVKEAVQAAMDLLKDLYDTRKFEDILLEEELPIEPQTSISIQDWHSFQRH